ncbi:unnamed protein product [Candidula unifasciata]|uniref:Uncharacterized protein n=1 Tax=Candidula unifasciata TaxID=100452 RepID=A0A8S3ZCD6_9EUPU|nr:unnamed protein product [Candidula unifasciata]
MDNILVLLCSIWISLIQADCPYQECQCISPAVLCMSRGLKALPELNKTVTGFTSLALDGNQITTITDGSLPSNLTDISLTDNPITTIDDTAFEGSKLTLRRLTISNARFTRIPDAFSQLQNLQTLHVIGVPVTDWNVEAMKNIGSTLETLYLERVNLATSPTWLGYFSRLTELDILSSFLEDIPDNAMDLMNNTMTYLNLYNNSLSEVPKSLSKLTSLLNLYLTENKIANTTWLPQSSKIQALSLNSNNINNAVQLSTSLLPYADSLQSLDIEDNQLSSFPELSFLTRIGTLSFRNNKLSDASSGSLPPKLYSLELQNNFLPRIPMIMSGLQSITDFTMPSNRITVIQSTDFSSVVTSVELGFNHITELTEYSFPKNSAIEYLYLNNNPLRKISVSAFNNLPILSDLSLQGTLLSRMPLALSSLTSLYSLDFTNTPSLVCTCLEKSLTSWVQARGPDVVSGDCGQITIYAFFTTFGPDCPND